MLGSGSERRMVLPDGRILEYWEGGDPAGRGVIFHPGTPVTRVLGRWGQGPALSAGVRLISVSRPGYGGSTTTSGVPSLLEVGRDTAALAAHLELDGYAVFGSSGGGPFAVATAVADPGSVRALGVVGGIGPWRLLGEPSGSPEDREDRENLELLDAGDIAGARSHFHQRCERRLGHLGPEEAVDVILSGEESSLVVDDRYRAIWLDNMRVVLGNLDGYVFDNLAWGGPWDVDPRDVAAPARLWYGTTDEHCPPETHGRWYDDRLADSRLILIPGKGHIDVIDGHWPDVLAGLLETWP